MDIYQQDEKTLKFIEKSLKVIRKINVTYGYMKTVYVHSSKEVIITCPFHGDFLQKPKHHLSGSGCQKCYDEVNRSTVEEFIRKSKIIQKEKNNAEYGYWKVVYVNARTKVILVCYKHGDFKQTPDNHLHGKVCPTCWKEKFNTERFIAKALPIQLKFNNVINDYSDTVYVNYQTPVIIGCGFCKNKFLQTPAVHLAGSCCPLCANNFKKSTFDEFINKANIIQNFKYGYNDSVYVNDWTDIIIHCPRNNHGNFKQKPSQHLQGSGCPKCKESRGEKAIRRYLLENNISFDSQYSFIECKNILPLPFDFVMFNKNKNCKALIEYQGRQHFESIEIWDGKIGLEKQQSRDKIKLDYCTNNNIPLLRIHYKDYKNIPKLLDEFIKSLP